MKDEVLLRLCGYESSGGRRSECFVEGYLGRYAVPHTLWWMAGDLIPIGGAGRLPQPSQTRGTDKKRDLQIWGACMGGVESQ